MYGKLFIAGKKEYVELVHRHSLPKGASFLLLRDPLHIPAVRVSRQWTHTTHTSAHACIRVTHTQPPLPAH